MNVSVCIASYNGEDFIKEQILSILNQIGSDDEVIVYDDCSSDETVQRVESIADSRVSLIKGGKNEGYARAFEKCLSKARGAHIFLSDQDDVWFPNKVEKVVSQLQFSDFVVHDVVYTDEALESLGFSGNSVRRLSLGFLANFFRLRVLGCAIAVNRKVLDLALPLPKNHDLMTHDAWLMMIATSSFSGKLIREPLMYYRRHNSNVSNGGRKSENGSTKKILIRLYAIQQLVVRFFSKIGR